MGYWDRSIRTYAIAAGLIILFLVAAFGITQDGFRFTYDSYKYVSTAQNLAQGEGLVHNRVKWDNPELEKAYSLNQPPIYSLFVAGLIRAGMKGPAAAAMLSLCSAALAAGLMYILLAASGFRWLERLVGTLAGVFTTGWLEAGLTAWTEPLFLLFVLGALMIMVRSWPQGGNLSMRQSSLSITTPGGKMTALGSRHIPLRSVVPSRDVAAADSLTGKRTAGRRQARRLAVPAGRLMGQGLMRQSAALAVLAALAVGTRYVGMVLVGVAFVWVLAEGKRETGRWLSLSLGLYTGLVFMFLLPLFAVNLYLSGHLSGGIRVPSESGFLENFSLAIQTGVEQLFGLSEIPGDASGTGWVIGGVILFVGSSIFCLMYVKVPSFMNRAEQRARMGEGLFRDSFSVSGHQSRPVIWLWVFVLSYMLGILFLRTLSQFDQIGPRLLLPATAVGIPLTAAGFVALLQKLNRLFLHRAVLVLVCAGLFLSRWQVWDTLRSDSMWQENYRAQPLTSPTFQWAEGHLPAGTTVVVDNRTFSLIMAENDLRVVLIADTRGSWTEETFAQAREVYGARYVILARPAAVRESDGELLVSLARGERVSGFEQIAELEDGRIYRF